MRYRNAVVLLALAAAGCSTVVKEAERAYKRTQSDDDRTSRRDDDRPAPSRGHVNDDDEAYRRPPSGDRDVYPTPAPDDRGPITRRPTPDDTTPLPPMRENNTNHGRLMLSQADFDRLKDLTQRDATARRWFELIRQRSEKALTSATPKEPASAEMLKVSRQMLSQLPTLSAMYRLTGDKRFADRAIADMLNVSSFHDWAPDDFLATGEMTNAVSIGYDWCYDAMSTQQRKTIASAIIRKGLQAGLSSYESGDGWTAAKHNWNLVCNGGLIVGALATADEDPRTSKRVLSNARKSIQSGLSVFAPDGAWDEGVTYWNYATRYLAFAMAALQSETGDDWGMSRAPGLSNSGYFRMYAVGPTGLPFNFADSEAEIGNSAQLMLFSKIFRNPAFAAYETRSVGEAPGIFDLLWYEPTDDAVLDRTPLKASFGGLDLVSMRGTWTDPNATWVAMKGGSNQSHHGHLDLGTFVLDAMGERWVTALGADNYNLPEYFGAKRWTYYRCATKGQNVFTVESRNQDPSAEARLVGETKDNRQPAAVLDLTQAYEKYAGRVRRGISMIDRRQVQLQDEIELSQTSEIVWAFHTPAEASAHGDTLTLRQNGKTMTVTLQSPQNARWEVQPVRLNAPQKPAEGISKVIIRITGARGRVRITTLFTPGETPPAEGKLVPLDRWTQPR